MLFVVAWNNSNGSSSPICRFRGLFGSPWAMHCFPKCSNFHAILCFFEMGTCFKALHLRMSPTPNCPIAPSVHSSSSLLERGDSFGNFCISMWLGLSAESSSDRFRLPNLWPPWIAAGAYLKALLACSSMPYIIINAPILTFCSNMFSKLYPHVPQVWASCGMVETSALVRPGLIWKPLSNVLFSKILQFPCNFTSIFKFPNYYSLVI